MAKATKTKKSAIKPAGKVNPFLLRLRDEHRVSQGKLVRLLDTTPRTIARYYAGTAKPVGTARALLSALEVAETKLPPAAFKAALEAGARFGGAALLAGALSQLGGTDQVRVAREFAEAAVEVASRIFSWGDDE